MLKKFGRDRTSIGAYHILRGKKSAQSLQDCHIFGLLPLFGVYKDLQRNYYLEQIEFLKDRSYIEEERKNSYVVTKAGEDFLEKELKARPLPTTEKNFKCKDITVNFWNRLSLTIQCISYLQTNNSSFVPIIKDGITQHWVKNRLFSVKLSDFAEGLHNEMVRILTIQPEISAQLFALRLSGSHRYGYTIDQAAEIVGIDPYLARLHFLSGVHELITATLKDQDTYPTLFSFLGDINVVNKLTASSEITLSLYNQGYSLSEIAAVRNLKVSTIEDHFVEIAMNREEFSIDPFVSEELQNKILHVIKKSNTLKLKEIKEHLDNTVSYFVVRLAIAKKGFNYEDRRDIV